jgi:hypothetical protein
MLRIENAHASSTPALGLELGSTSTCVAEGDDHHSAEDKAMAVPLGFPFVSPENVSVSWTRYWLFSQDCSVIAIAHDCSVYRS